MKKVSLLLTTYNSEAVLKKTLDSIEMQDYPDIEVCIADSCSVDKTLDIIKEYQTSSKYSVVYDSKPTVWTVVIAHTAKVPAVELIRFRSELSFIFYKF